MKHVEIDTGEFAYVHGVIGFKAKKTLDQCPYDPRDEYACVHWRAGWTDAQDEASQTIDAETVEEETDAPE